MINFSSIEAYAIEAAGALVKLFSAPSSFLSPLPILIAVIIAAAIIVHRQRQRGEKVSVGSIAQELAPAESLRHPSARHDIWIIVINDGLLFFLPVLAAISIEPIRYAAIEMTGITHALARPPTAGMFHMIAFGIYFALVWDFFATYAHYLKHKIPILWEFHKVHHCAEVLTPLTAMRRHPVEIVISAMITGTGVMLAMVIWTLIFGAPGTAHQIGGLAVIVYAWRLLGYNIRHSHLWISYGPFWNNILVSPAHHQLHHSREPSHYDCNFGHIFSFWDRLLGTLYHPCKGEKIEFGIEREENEKLNTLAALYIRPMKMAMERLLPAKPAPAAEAAE